MRGALPFVVTTVHHHSQSQEEPYGGGQAGSKQRRKQGTCTQEPDRSSRIQQIEFDFSKDSVMEFWPQGIQRCVAGIPEHRLGL